MTSIRRRSTRALSGLLFGLAVSTGALVGQECPAASGPQAQAGWDAYTEGDIAEARARFDAALGICPDDLYARTGLGYVELRQGNDDRARDIFLAVVSIRTTDRDALVGLGIEAWRRGDLDEVATRFGRVLEVHPEDPAALDYLGRLPEGIGPPPERPPLVLPDTTTFPARAIASRLEVRTADGWEPFYVKGVNLGAALPGRNPSEFPDAATYREWIAEMAAMGANVVRVYTIHPPRFYDALADWNRNNPWLAIRIIHGVWTELPEDGDYLGLDFEEGFFREMERVVDVVHGRADLRPRPGNASGFYTSDVSDWTLAWIIGREWEPFSSMAFDSISPGFRSWDGAYVSLEEGNPMEAWLTRALDHMVAYETDTYREQRPVAYTNWPTLDPMTHPTETTREEEVRIRRALGEIIDFEPREYDNDILGLDATRMEASGDFEAGLFASFHAYPYYPDFMLLQPSYAEAASSFGPSNYFGYLQDLAAAHPNMPVVISEYGVPSSHGSAHLQPQGQHHGGLSEAQMAEIDRRLTLELAEAGMAGGVLFAWIDEWFKKNWLVVEFERPLERNRLWYNRLDAEQHYGVLAIEPELPVPGATMSERAAAWTDVVPLYSTADGTVRAAHDAAYLWLRIETPGHTAGDRTLVGFDIVAPEAGDRRWPGAVGPEIPVGIEFVLVEDGDGLRVMADPPVNPMRFAAEGTPSNARPGVQPEIENAPPGFFRARLGQRFNTPWVTEPNQDGVYDSLRVIPNRRRVSRDSLEYLAMGYDRGVLPRGPLPDGFWEREGDVLEVRIPWLLINVTDPSSRSVLASPVSEAAGIGRTATGLVRMQSGMLTEPDTLIGDLGERSVDAIRIVAARQRSDGSWGQWPASGGAVAPFTWPTWEAEDLGWSVRRRPAFDAMRDAFEALVPELIPAFRATGDGPSGARTGAAGGAGSSVRPPGDAPPGGVARDTIESPRQVGARAWADGDLETAERAYEQILTAAPTDEQALHRLALIHAWRDETDTALEYFDRLLAAHPANVDARIDRARALAWAGREGEAVAALDVLLEQRPGYLPALEARATFLAWAGEFDRAVDGYDQLLAGMGDARPLRLQRARVLSWAERYDQSLAALDSLVTADPADVEARLGRGAARSFAGDLEGARRDYESVLAAAPDDVRALQGLGRAQSWSGRLVAGERTLRRAVAVDGADVSSLVGLAQNLRWQGRNAAALDVLEQARDLAPGDPDVREQMQWVRVATAPRASLSYTTEADSDGNDMRTTSLVAQINPVPRLTLRADLYRRDADAPGLDRQAIGGGLTASWQFEPGWSVSAGAGGSENDGSRNPSALAWNAALSSPGRHAVTATLAAAGAALDGTAALADLGVETTRVAVDAAWTHPSGLRVAGGAATTEFEGTESNRRTSGSLSVQQRAGRVWTVGATGRAFGFENDLDDGYFDPDFFGLAEVWVRWLYEPSTWSLQLEGAPGVQKVGSEGDVAGALRVSGRVAWRAAPGREIWIAGGWSSAGLQRLSATGGADYRYEALSAGISWVR